MKEAIKLTTITGRPCYVAALFNVQAIHAAKDGDMEFTELHLPGVVFRVKESAEHIAGLLGWGEKTITPAEAPKPIA